MLYHIVIDIIIIIIIIIIICILIIVTLTITIIIICVSIIITTITGGRVAGCQRRGQADEFENAAHSAPPGRDGSAHQPRPARPIKNPA